MEVAAVTTSDRSLLHAVRSALAEAREAFLCVAFAQEKGIHNRPLLADLRVHRSSAVCAILARMPGVRVRPGKRITLEWVRTQ